MSDVQEFVDPHSDHAAVCGFLHRPEDHNGDCLILTHGAGANCASPLLTALATAFCSSGMLVLRYNLPFRQARPHGPPARGSAELDQQGLRWAVRSIRQQAYGRAFLGGHSYGGRQASIAAAAEPDLIDGLFLLSYPLHPPKQPTVLRTKHFPDLQTPAMFVHGTRDPFGSIDEMKTSLKLIPARTELHEVSGAGHELLTKQNRDELPKTIVEAFTAWFTPSQRAASAS